MAEEETGFTFVDKRRLQPENGETAPETVPEIDSEPPVSAVSPEMDADPGSSDPVPDIYGVIGYCISLLATEAWQKMGLLADPNTGVAVADLAQAKTAIDAVSDLAARLESAPTEVVPEALRRDLRTLVNDLRLNYVSQRGDNNISRN